ncbi:MAG: FkbM family methyltransferase [Spirochaetota bacterium]
MNDFLLYINAKTEDKKKKLLSHEFVYSNRPKYIMGRNEFALSLAKNIKIDGFIDDFTALDSWEGKPIIPIDEVPKHAIVAIAVVYGRPLTAVRRIEHYNLDYIDYFSLLKYTDINLLPLQFIEGFEKDFKIYTIEYQNIYEKLADEESKQQFINLINFRLTYDLIYMKDFKNIQEYQYIEPFIILNAGYVFVDIGGYDGTTTEMLIQKYPNYKSIYFFEPDEANMNKAKNKLDEYKNIFYYLNGLSNKKERLYFKSSGSSSKIDIKGDIVINTIILDDCINEKCTYIKMDVEGWECNVIEGSKRIIKEYKPQLAICVYHKCDDMWKIPKKILSIRDDYKIFLRHYTEGITETVMYFI